MAFVPDEFPGTVLVGVFGTVVIFRRWVVLLETFLQIVRRAYVESARRILKNIDPEWTFSYFQTPRVGLEPTT